MTTQHSIQLQSGAVKIPYMWQLLSDSKLADEWIKPKPASQLCIHCTNQSKYEYLGMKLCYPHYLSEERVNE